MPAAAEGHMGESVEDIYQQIGIYIVEAIDDDWIEASIDMEIGTGSGRGNGRYRKEGVDDVLSFPLRYDVVKLFEELRTRLQKPGAESWSKATFRLKRDGTFSLDLEYQDSR
jgi:hypothetical protein